MSPFNGIKSRANCTISQLKCHDITVKDDYLVIKSKTDQYRAGDEIVVSKNQSLACPYTMLMKYVGLANVNILALKHSTKTYQNISGNRIFFNNWGFSSTLS
jgi:hypothetical protein